jgi:TRAP-type C4-dicarboxylate transport system substrate-binding protein
MTGRKLLGAVGGVCLILVLVMLPLRVGFAPERQAKAAPEKKVITLKVTSFVGPKIFGSGGDSLGWWADELEKRSEGKVKIERYWFQSLVKAPEMIEAGKTGLADVVHYAGLGADLPFEATVIEFGRTEYADAVSMALTELYETFPAFREQFERQNLRVMYFNNMYPLVIGSRKPIKTLNDLKKLKIRTLGYGSKIFSNLGSVPVTLPAPDVYDAMQRGTIDAWSWMSLSGVIMGALYEVTPYITDPRFGCYGHNFFAMNMDTWKALPDDVKNIIKRINTECRAWTVANQMEQEKKILRRPDIKFYVLPRDEAKRWLDASKHDEVCEAWAAKTEARGLPARKYRERFIELIKKYEGSAEYIPLEKRLPH